MGDAMSSVMNAEQKRNAFRRVIQRDGTLCCYCDVQLRTHKRWRNHPLYATIEHVKRTADGGSNRIENLKLACVDCNSSRENTPPHIHRQRMLAKRQARVVEYANKFDKQAEEHRRLMRNAANRFRGYREQVSILSQFNPTGHVRATIIERAISDQNEASLLYKAARQILFKLLDEAEALG